MQHMHTDVVIIGGGLGGVAAAIQICQSGLRCCIVEPTQWLGGQASSQGVSALDEHRYIETFGGSPTYMQMRTRIRREMAQLHNVTIADMANFNPGTAWVSNLCFYPSVAAQVLADMVQPFVDQGLCQVFYDYHLVQVDRIARQIHTVTAQHGASHHTIVLNATFFIDASEQGDVLALANLRYVVGAESRHDTGEARAPLQAIPSEIQGFTYCFAVEYCAGEDHRIAKPEGYAELRDRQPFTLTLTGEQGEARPFRVFTTGETGLPPFWTYRRLWDGSHSTPPMRDVAMINWNSNDYHHGTIIDVPAHVVAARLDEAKRLSLAFLYWMQTEMPRDDGNGHGYPELRLIPEMMGTADGLSMSPYIRESRRTPGLLRIVAEDLLASSQPLARAKHYPDSIGVGWYFMDLHPAPGNPTSMFSPTRPFQIPLRALIPPDCDNVLMGCKNIATTHLSNGSYRLHPVEWNIGLAAGECVVLASVSKRSPADIAHTAADLATLQRHLIEQGQALAWAVDVPPTSPYFVPTQLALLAGAVCDPSPRAHQLEIVLDAPLQPAEWQWFMAQIAHTSTHIERQATWRTACEVWLAAHTGLI